MNNKPWYFPTHLYDQTGEKPVWIGYLIKKELGDGLYKSIAVVYHRNTLKKVLKALNGDK